MARGTSSKSNRGVPSTQARSKDTGLPAFFKARQAASSAAEASAPSKQPQLSKTARRKAAQAKRHAAADARTGGAGKGGGGDEEMQDAIQVDQPFSTAAAAAAGEQAISFIDEDERNLYASLAALNTKLLAPRTAKHAGAIKPESDGFSMATFDPALTGRKDSSSRAYMRELRKVLELSDVLLEVLDARDPMGCRSLATERLALSSGKRVVLVLNKIDLVPRANVEAWLRYLRNEFPVLAFKSSTQSQRSHLSHSRASAPTAASAASGSGSGVGARIAAGSEALGATALVSLLKAYARKDAGRASLTVGVFGAPNVGKSSLVNSLVRSKACAVAATPGQTKVVQGVVLDKGLKLLDCPGVVFLGPEDGAGALQALRNTIKVELVDDPVAPVEAILARVPSEQLVQLYSIQGGFDEGDVQDFLMRVALLKGKLGKGGIPDLEGTARIVLHDWNMGKIAYYTQPPALHASHVASASVPSNTASAPAPGASLDPSATTAAAAAGSSIVTGFSEAFDLAALLGAADAEVLGAGTGLSSQPAPAPPKRRYAVDEPALSSAPSASASAEMEIEAQQQQKQAKMDVSLSSSLGKRRRGMDDDVISDSEEEEDWKSARAASPSSSSEIFAAPSSSASALTPMGAGAPAGTSNKAEPEWKARERARGTAPDAKHRKRLLSSLPSSSSAEPTLFSAADTTGLASLRGSARRKAKKQRKRDAKAGAGLVEELEAAMDLGTRDELEPQLDGEGVGAKGKRSTMGAFAALAYANAGEMTGTESSDVHADDEGEEEEEL